MSNRWASGWIVVSCALGVLGCSGGGGGGGLVAPAATASPGGSPGSSTTPRPSFDPSTWPKPPAARVVEQGAFATSMACWNCHGSDPVAMRDSAGRDVSPYELWQGSMMANAARDPLWRAEISVEIAATPSARRAIETKCLSCHTPMGVADAQANLEALTIADLDADTGRGQLALDGVSCSMCHQIEATANVASTYGGAYTLGATREIYGPHANPYTLPMSIQLNYAPTEGQHTMSSDLCASCHTLFTSALDASGNPTGGQIPEQTPYLEWLNSTYNDQVASPSARAVSCQGCHLPTADVDGNPIATQIARGTLGTAQRSQYGRHTFVGGNTLVPQILKDQRADLKPLASDAAFDAVVDETRRQLRSKTATVTLGTLARMGSDLVVPVTVQNLTGHKFPTGHPVRRAWLRLVVRDAAGRVVFGSGEYDASGRIVNGGAVLPSEVAGGPTQPHYPLISSPSQVQIYQSLMADGNGDVTFLLLRGEGYAKDNRLLPLGWSSTHPTAADTAPQGVGGDGDFTGGADQVIYRVPAPSGSGPYQVEATLLFQPLSARFAAELFEWATPEVDAFRSYYQAASRTPEVVDQASATAP